MLLDVPRQLVRDLGVAWNRLALTGPRIPIDVVPSTVAQELTAMALELAQELGPFQSARRLVL